MKSKNTLPVVVAGAGPTGLMCAIALARQGIPVVVLEGEPTLTHDLRAGTFHPPTLEMMAPYGITARMHELGIPVRYWQVRQRRGGMVAQFDLATLADITPYPYRLHLEQHRLTPIQLDILRKESGAEVRFAHKVLGFEQNADRVRVSFETDGRTGYIDAAFLVGADGGRSVVRKQTGTEFEGFTWPEQFMVVSTKFDFGQHGYAMNCYIADPEEWCAVFKMPDDDGSGLWRMALPVDPNLPEAHHLAAENVERKMQAFHEKPAAYDILYKSTYSVHQRVAKEWHLGRVLLAGDAAHLNNPLGGFGLNSGIHDAISLSEKLGPVYRGEADDAALGVYERQRRNATVEQVQKVSIRNKKMLEERDVAVQRQRMQEMIDVSNDPARMRTHLLETSMISGLAKAAEIQ